MRYNKLQMPKHLAPCTFGIYLFNIQKIRCVQDKIADSVRYLLSCTVASSVIIHTDYFQLAHSLFYFKYSPVLFQALETICL